MPTTRIALAAAALLIGLPAITAHDRLHFYLTKDDVTGDQALGACDPGFHMASVFELTQMGGLAYDTVRGRAEDDSGHGPPAGSNEARGWIRSGRPSSASGNCSAWTTIDGKGLTLVFFERTRILNVSPYPDIAWRTGTKPCSNRRPVWCIQDHPLQP